MHHPYKRVRVSSTKLKDRHRILKEKQLGRELSSDEIVHHILPGNDKAIFTKITNRSDHARKHMSDLWKKDRPKIVKKIRIKMGGHRSSSAKLNWNKVYLIRRLYKKGAFNSIQLGRFFNVNASTIRSICNRETWKRPYLTAKED
jgi:DNA invertase Pin-like site-specific DNA recombinase